MKTVINIASLLILERKISKIKFIVHIFIETLRIYVHVYRIAISE